ncbi:MAG: hypothetical protein NT031_19635, partial [Planctomycetota bacterium]|nr:hypothetical protein [Planctomycetota bacterium]
MTTDGKGPDMTDQPASARAVPQAISDMLETLISRARTVLLLRGVAAVVGTGVAALLVVMAVGRFTAMASPWPRVALSVSALAATALAAVVFLIRPLARSFSLVGAARIIEVRHPELHERISSAVELLSGDDPDSIRGSASLIAALAGQAAVDAALVVPRQEVSSDPARPFVLAAAGALAVLVLLFAFWARATGQLLTQALAPLRDTGTFGSYQLTVAPGDTVVREGAPLTV